jgi:hypothetical protein
MEREAASSHEPKTSKVVVWCITIAWLTSGAAYLYFNLTAFMALPPNGWGDTLAGFFAPLAFLWLVAGYMQQGAELKQNTDALNRQATELANTVALQTKMVEATNKELSLLDQQLQLQKFNDIQRVQPSFHVQGGNTHVHGTNPRLQYQFLVLNVFNDGHTVNLLNVTPNKLCPHLSCECTLPKSVKSQSSFKINLRHYENLEKILIDFTFADGHNETRQITLLLSYASGDWSSSVSHATTE